MGIRIDSKGLRRVLEETPPEQNVMLTGKHGIGKSRILEDYFTEKGQRVVILFLGQMSDPGDLIVLPYKDEKTGKQVLELIDLLDSLLKTFIQLLNTY